ncbi:MAG: sugar kinase, partial [Gemmatimonadetes bacterium]|nr:sugar kinase [Gemmatimonadota bacterium]
FPEEGNEFLSQNGIDTQGLTRVAGKTFQYEAEYPADMQDRKTIRTDLNVFEHFRPAIPDSYKDTPIVFLGNIDPVLQIEVLDQVKGPKHVAADTMNYWIHGHRENLIKMLGRIDTLILNDSEARELTGESNLVAALRAITAMGPSIVIMKKGEHGALLYQDGDFFHVPAFPVEIVKDPTGAGDAFAGGVLGFIARCGKFDRRTWMEAMQHGTAVASFVVEEFGPAPLRQLDHDKIESRIARLRAMVTLP